MSVDRSRLAVAAALAFLALAGPSRALDQRIQPVRPPGMPPPKLETMPRPTQSRNGPTYIGGGWYRTPSGATVNAGGPPPRPVAPGGIR